MPSGIFRRTKETRDKMRRAKLGDKNPAKRPEIRKKKSEAMIKFYQKAENTNCGFQKGNKINVGRKVSKKTREKISLGNLEKKIPRSVIEKGKITKRKNFELGLWKGPMLGKHHSPETIEKLRNKPYIGGGNFSKYNKLEKLFAKILRKNGYTYSRYKKVCNISTDFYIKPNIVIFCDGDYWHNLPEVIERDKRQNIRLLNEGYKIYRFSETRIHELDSTNEKLIIQ